MLSQDAQWILQEKYKGEKTEGFFNDFERLKNGEPLAFIIGNIPFLDATIYLDSHPLIPRVETEFWVGEALKVMHTHTEPSRILDMCAGSGCIGVAVGMAFKNAHIDFIEIDETHHTTIQKNCDRNGLLLEKISILKGDIFDTEVPLTKKYDYILCNPPYLDESLDRVQESVLKYEPHRALFASNNGLSLIERLILEAPAYMHVESVLYIEHEPEQREAIFELATKNTFTCVTHNDQYGVARYSTLRVAQ